MGAVLIAGCGGGSAAPATSITIEIIPPITGTSVDVGATQVLTFTAGVGGDTTNQGVAWKLSGTSCSGAGCGTLSAETSSSVGYTAPTGLPSSSALSVTLTATAVADDKATKTATITVQPAPSFSTAICNPVNVTNPCALPTGANGVAYSQAIQITGGVAPYTFAVLGGGFLPDCLSMNPGPTRLTSTAIFGKPCGSGASAFTVQVTDSGGAAPVTQNYSLSVNPAPALSIVTTSLDDATRQVPYSETVAVQGGVAPLQWSIVPGSGGLPASFSLSSVSGVISGTPTALDMLQSSCAPVVAGKYCFTVQVKDAALPTNQTATQALSITIQTPPDLVITTPPGALTGGSTATAYVASLQATGGILPYTWTVTEGQLPAGLTLTTLIDGTGSISGTPIVATPAGTPDSFTVQLTDSVGSTPLTPPPQFSITITAGADNNKLLTGTYSFLFNGFDADGAVMIAGSITADGAGNITSGAEVSNRISGVVPPPSPFAVTGTYSIGSDGRGTMEVTSEFVAGGTPKTITADYSLAIESDGSIRFFQYHPSPAPSPNPDTTTNGTGIMKPVLGAGFGPGSFSGNYALRLSGQDLDGKPAALVGVVHADGSSQTLTQGNCDFNDAGNYGSCQPLSGDFSLPASGLPIANLTFVVPGKAQVNLKFVFIFVSSSDLFLVEIDSDSNGNPTIFRLSGEMILQQPSVTFDRTSLAGASVVTGAGVAGSNSSVMAGLLSSPLCDGTPASAILGYDENSGGTLAAPSFAGTCSIALSGSNGRAAFTGLGASAADTRLAVAYLTGPSQGFFLGSDAAVTSGLLEQQTPGLAFSNATVQGSYAVGAPFFGESQLSGISGQVNAKGDGSLAGTVDVNASAAAPNFNATNSAPASNGRGTMTTTPPVPTGFPTDLIFYVVTPGNIRAISADAGDAHPQAIFLDH